MSVIQSTPVILGTCEIQRGLVHVGSPVRPVPSTAHWPTTRARQVRRAGFRRDAPASCRSLRSCQAPSVIIHDLHVTWPVVRPPEADTPLHVDPNAVLIDAVAPQHFQPVARQCGRVSERLGAVRQDQSARRPIGEALKRRDALPLEEARVSGSLKLRIMHAGHSSSCAFRRGCWRPNSCSHSWRRRSCRPTAQTERMTPTVNETSHIELLPRASYSAARKPRDGSGTVSPECAVGAAAQAPLGLTASQITACMVRTLEREKRDRRRLAAVD